MTTKEQATRVTVMAMRNANNEAEDPATLIRGTDVHVQSAAATFCDFVRNFASVEEQAQATSCGWWGRLWWRRRQRRGGGDDGVGESRGENSWGIPSNSEEEHDNRTSTAKAPVYLQKLEQILLRGKSNSPSDSLTNQNNMTTKRQRSTRRQNSPTVGVQNNMLPYRLKYNITMQDVRELMSRTNHRRWNRAIIYPSHGRGWCDHIPLLNGFANVPSLILSTTCIRELCFVWGDGIFMKILGIGQARGSSAQEIRPFGILFPSTATIANSQLWFPSNNNSSHHLQQTVPRILFKTQHYAQGLSSRYCKRIIGSKRVVIGAYKLYALSVAISDRYTRDGQGELL